MRVKRPWAREEVDAMCVKEHWPEEEVDVMRVLSAVVKKDLRGRWCPRNGITEDIRLE